MRIEVERAITAKGVDMRTEVVLRRFQHPLALVDGEAMRKSASYR